MRQRPDVGGGVGLDVLVVKEGGEGVEPHDTGLTSVVTSIIKEIFEPTNQPEI